MGGVVGGLLNRSRYLVVIAVAGLSVTTVATFIWAVAKTVKLVDKLLDGGWRDDVTLVDLLSVLDIYLLAIVQLIVMIGLFELFIAPIEGMPDWLEVSSIDDLKKSLVDVFVVFLGVLGIRGLISTKEAQDALMWVGGVALLIASLSFFRLATKKK